MTNNDYVLIAKTENRLTNYVGYFGAIVIVVLGYLGAKLNQGWNMFFSNLKKRVCLEG